MNLKMSGDVMEKDKIYANKLISEYSHKSDSKIIKLKKMDKKVRKVPNVFAYTFGIISCMILGIGMCLVLVNGKQDINSFIIGIIIGVLGIILMCLNYPIYNILLKKSKDKYASVIIKLASEVCNDEENI